MGSATAGWIGCDQRVGWRGAGHACSWLPMSGRVSRRLRTSAEAVAATVPLGRYSLHVWMMERINGDSLSPADMLESMVTRSKGTITSMDIHTKITYLVGSEDGGR